MLSSFSGSNLLMGYKTCPNFTKSHEQFTLKYDFYEVGKLNMP